MKVSSTSTLGFPRMGPNRDLKFALEKYWKGLIKEKALADIVASIEDQAWALQKAAGVDRITVGDHYLYDGILTWTEYLGVIPARHKHLKAGLTRMFAMARGVDGATALSMKKWITSNYHYMVPEFDGTINADFSSFYAEVGRGLNVLGARCATPVIIGPVTMAYLTKFASFSTGYEAQERLSFLVQLLPIYKKLLGDLAAMGFDEIQIHEAALVMEDPYLLEYFNLAYPAILLDGPAINMVSFMEDVGEKHYEWLISVDRVSIVSLDFTRGENLIFMEKHGFPTTKTLGAGLVDSRSVWCVDPSIIKPVLDRLAQVINDSPIRIQPSGSLQYNPWDLSCETELLAHPAGQVLSFAAQKLGEVRALADAVNKGWSLLDGANWTNYRAAVVNGSNPDVRNRTNLVESDFCRAEPFAIRRPKQLKSMKVALPTTTIGSFPQTADVRRLRSQYKRGIISEDEYNALIDQQIALAIGIQEGLGLDILVHGESERTDMVEFFGQKLDGMLFSRHGWVQSFGSRWAPTNHLGRCLPTSSNDCARIPSRSKADRQTSQGYADRASHDSQLVLPSKRCIQKGASHADRTRYTG
ncbi:5-methyltetrahydropteroyltriglutamate-homocysteine S-methyltransferase [Fragilaria crotonensis]|nr:5-methyltetrahydropteroyltriglutamate-homocysteine S-methyltransferase [Fragilaria crotonensis]